MSQCRLAEQISCFHQQVCEELDAGLHAGGVEVGEVEAHGVAVVQYV